MHKETFRVERIFVNDAIILDFSRTKMPFDLPY